MSWAVWWSPTSTPADGGTRFRLFEQVVALIAGVAARRPVVLVVDDLQWADVASLELFTHLTDRLPRGAVVVGALRDRAPVPGTELARTLASASRSADHRRIRLNPFDLDDVAELIRRESGREPDPEVVRAVHARTAGNAFFVRELARLGVLGDGVPSSVRDVVRERIAGLTGEVLGLLQVAALIGREIDLLLLARAARLETPECLDGLEPLEELGLLEPVPGHPRAVRFVHDLVRESVADLTPQGRLAHLHVQVADALESTSPGDDSTAERLAHHLRAAGPLADPARTVDTLIRAGRSASGKSALDAASRQLRSAARVAQEAGLAERELTALSMLTAVDGMRAGYAGSTPEVLERAENLARDLGHERQATDFLFSRWASHGQALQLDKSGPLARRLLIQGEASGDPIVRAHGLHAWGIHQWATGNIGQAYRYLIRSTSTMRDDLVRRDDDPLRHDLQSLSPLMLALMTGLRGDLVHARAMFDRLECAARRRPLHGHGLVGLRGHPGGAGGRPGMGVERGRTRDRAGPPVRLRLLRRLPAAGAMLGARDDRPRPGRGRRGGGADHRHHVVRPAALGAGHLVRAAQRDVAGGRPARRGRPRPRPGRHGARHLWGARRRRSAAPAAGAAPVGAWRSAHRGPGRRGEGADAGRRA